MRGGTAGAVSLRGLAAVVLAAGVVLGTAAPAWAHASGGVAPTNWKSPVCTVVPAMSGVDVRTVENGDYVRLRNDSSVEVTVLGYGGEPYLRIGHDGVFENTRSAAAYLNRTRDGRGDVPAAVSEGADRAGPPDWRRVADGPEYTWHDHRTHWMGGELPPSVRGDPTRRQVVSDWTLSMRHGDTPVTVSGRLTWVPAPTSWPWYAVALGLLGCGLAAGLSRRWRAPVWALLAALLVADLTHTVAGGLPDGAFEVVGELGPSAAAWVLGAAALLAVVRRRAFAPYLVATVGAVVAVVSGLGDLAVLDHSQLPTAGPAWLARLCVAVALGLGAGLAASGWVVSRREQPLPAPDGESAPQPAAPASR